MCSNKIFIIAVLLGFVLQCNGPMQNNSKKTVSLTSHMNYYVPDSASLTRVNSYVQSGKKMAKLSAVMATIDPTQIMVMTVNINENAMRQQAMDSYAYDSIFWQNHNKKKWEDEVAYYRNYPSGLYSVVYQGELERDGNYAKGVVDVEQGQNQVFVGFVVSGDTLAVMADAFYYWNFISYGANAMPDGWSSYGSIGDTVVADSSHVAL